ncbi:hypothetical protein PIB30_065249 [Stylosanthes scabra]|uniref:F-box protein n=1 Tax=Stylosanthes scabra TaxID=79078 RepID=A0ABU6QMD6_9FABA|nr:hypothetical protein [Stylosanthes scabra]
MGAMDALESKQRKGEQGEMPEEGSLCLVTYRELYVIKLSSLKKQDDVKDWTRLPPLEFDFVLELPEPGLCPFEFESKIYMASSVMPNFLGTKSLSYVELNPTPIYEFKFEEPSVMPVKSLGPAPVPFHRAFIANTPDSGDVFFHIGRASKINDLPPFFILSSSSRVWEPLTLPPCFSDLRTRLMMFVLQNNLFVCSDIGVCFTYEDVKYEEEEEEEEEEEVEEEDPDTHVEKVFAILVNHNNGSVALYQRLCLASYQGRKISA